ncbi:conserved hypothetical protein [Candidatus Brocadia pituitae]|nr:conserved hypothetical protein [Candidatus Brocadia pituitae]
MKSCHVLFCTIPFYIMTFSYMEIFTEQQALSGNVAEQETTIEQVLEEVQKGLINAQQEIKNMGMPQLESVKLTLQTAMSKKSGAKLKVFIFSFGQEWEKERSQELALTLKPPLPPFPLEEPIPYKVTLADKLSEAIVSVAKGVQKARTSEQPLEIEQFTAEFNFIVQTEIGGKVAFEISPITAETEGDLKKKAIHKIAVTFKR